MARNRLQMGPVKKILRAALQRSGLLWLDRTVRQEHITILMLHGIKAAHADDLWEPLRAATSPEVLAEVLAILEKHYRFITLSDAVRIMNCEKDPVRNGLVVTIDDGHANNLSQGLPVFSKFGIAPTLFIATGHVSGRVPFWFDRLDYAIQAINRQRKTIRVGNREMLLDTTNRISARNSYKEIRDFAKRVFPSDDDMNSFFHGLAEDLESEAGSRLLDIFEMDEWSKLLGWDEIESAATSGAIEVGSHTVNHKRINRISELEATWELTQSKEEIEKRLGRRCQAFCYPDGSLDESSRRIVEACGYEVAVTNRIGFNKIGDDRLLLRRISFPKIIDETELLVRLSGFHNWIHA